MFFLLNCFYSAVKLSKIIFVVLSCFVGFKLLILAVHSSRAKWSWSKRSYIVLLSNCLRRAGGSKNREKRKRLKLNMPYLTWRRCHCHDLYQSSASFWCYWQYFSYCLFTSDPCFEVVITFLPGTIELNCKRCLLWLDLYDGMKGHSHHSRCRICDNFFTSISPYVCIW